MKSQGKPTVAEFLGKNFKPTRQKTPTKPKEKPICPFCGSKNSRQKNETDLRKCSDCEKLFITPNSFFKNKKF
jgi:ribosomal protein L37AE/L43A